MNRHLISFVGNIADKLGGECWLVGGAVRDFLLGIQPKDYDFVSIESEEIVDAICAHMKEIFDKDVTVTRYRKFGTYQIRLFDNDCEFTIPRAETYTLESHKPKVVASTYEEDLKRRDFTINTLRIRCKNMTFDHEYEIRGTEQTLKDLSNKVLRCVSNPDDTFKDDPSRLLRLARYMSKGFRVEERTRKSAIRNAEEVLRIPHEAVFQTINRSVMLRGYFSNLYRLGLLEVLFPVFRGMKELTSEHHVYDALIHSLKTTRFATRPVIKYSALFHDVGKKVAFKLYNNYHGHEIYSERLARTYMERYKFPKEYVEDVCYAVKHHMDVFALHKNPTKRAIRRFVVKQFDKIHDLFELAKIDAMAKSAKSPIPYELDALKIEVMETAKRLNSKAKFKLAINGNDVMRILNIEEGPKVGEVLRKLEEEVINGAENTEKSLTKILNNYGG